MLRSTLKAQDPKELSMQVELSQLFSLTFCFSEIESYCIAQVDLEFTIVLSQSECRDYGFVLPCGAQSLFLWKLQGQDTNILVYLLHQD